MTSICHSHSHSHYLTVMYTASLATSFLFWSPERIPVKMSNLANWPPYSVGGGRDVACFEYHGMLPRALSRQEDCWTDLHSLQIPRFPSSLFSSFILQFQLPFPIFLNPFHVKVHWRVQHTISFIVIMPGYKSPSYYSS